MAALKHWYKIEGLHRALHLLSKRVATRRYIPSLLTYNQLRLTVKAS